MTRSKLRFLKTRDTLCELFLAALSNVRISEEIRTLVTPRPQGRPAYVPTDSYFAHGLSPDEIDYVADRVERYMRVLSSVPWQEDSPTMDRDLQTAAAMFDAGLYFECHDFLESLWRSAPRGEREFLKALIWACVAMYHLERGNRRGARNYIGRSTAALRPYVHRGYGIDVAGLIDSLLRLKKVLDSQDKGKANTPPLEPPRMMQPRPPIRRG